LIARRTFTPAAASALLVLIATGALVLPAADIGTGWVAFAEEERPAAAGESTQAGDSLGVSGGEAEIKAKEDELQQIRRDLEEKRRQAADVAGQEQDLAGEVERLNEELDMNQQLLNKLSQQKAVLLDDLGNAQQDLGHAQASLGMASDMLGSRLRGIYKFGRGQVMEVVLTSKSFADLAKRIYYLSVVADHDRELMADFEQTVETKRVLVDHIEGKKVRLEQTETEVAEETRNLGIRKEERDALVERLKSKRSYYENMARELQEASRNLEEMLGRLEAKREETGYAGTSFAGRIGRLIWPCEGEVISSFGVETHPKFGTIIKNNGIDIKATAGARVRTVAAGSVSFAGPLAGLGNCVIVDHGSGYYSLYGRLESLAVATGYEVAEGDPVGFIGETSAPEGAVLHFEIRQGRRALDPQAWLIR
jgi:septal ring factor EnvC (AmiA/AmiB activator)